jgi:MFS family permease
MAGEKEYDPTYDPEEPSPLERKLWVGLLLGPLAWIIALMVGYPIAAEVCGTRGMILTAALTLVTAAAAVAGTLLSRSLRRRMERDQEGGPRRADRRILMAYGGTGLGLMMIAIIAGHGIALLFLRPC